MDSTGWPRSSPPAENLDSGDGGRVPPPLRLEAVDTAVFIDTFSQGPYHEPIPVTNWREFQMLFGGFHATSEASYGVFLFFENGGEFAWIVRVPDPAESGLSLVGAGGDRQASPRAMADTLIGDPAQSTGIYSIRSLTRKKPGIVCIPRAAELGTEGVRVYREAIALCADMGMMLLVDPPLLADSSAELLNWLNANPDLASPWAALYYPRFFFPDALQHGRNRSFGPSGAVAGLYSWLDQERGIWKAPAGLHAALEAITPTREVDAAEIALLTRAGVNPVRDLAGHGAVLWGARTLGSPFTADPVDRYVSLRRFVNAVERSLRNDLRWAELEPNDEPLWEKVRQAVDVFLTGLFREEALQGSTGKDAFFVNCDRSTMTQADIDSGRLIALIGIALVRPGEFHLIRVVLSA